MIIELSSPVASEPGGGGGGSPPTFLTDEKSQFASPKKILYLNSTALYAYFDIEIFKSLESNNIKSEIFHLCSL